MVSPAVSVVIATLNRASYLNLTLAALERQRLPTLAWELVVVDENSRDHTQEVLDAWEDRCRIRLRRRRGCGLGRAAALNQAMEEAQGEIIILLGEDRLVGPGFLLRHVAWHTWRQSLVFGSSHRWVHTHLYPLGEIASEGFRGNPTMDECDLDLPESWASRTFAAGRNFQPLWKAFRESRVHNRFPWVYADAGNLSAQRTVLLRTGGFDCGRDGWNLGEWGLCCQELAYRLHRSGLTCRYAERAIALRQVGPQPAIAAGDVERNVGYFFAKHPEADRRLLTPILVPQQILF